MSTTSDPRRLLRRVGLIAPIVVAVIGAVAQAAAIPALPDPVAVHWGVSGTPDGFGPVWLPAVLTAVIGILLPVVVSAAVLLQRSVDPRWKDRGASYRFLGAVSLGATVFVVTLITSATLLQIGVADAADAPAIWPSMAAALVAAGVAGVVAWRLLPAGTPPAPGSTEADPAPLPLGDSEQAVWMRTVTMSRVGLIVLVAAAVVMAGMTVLMFSMGSGAAAWIVLGTTALVVVLAATTVSYRVTVDESGLAVRSIAGLPRFFVPLSVIRGVEVTVVEPMLDFGGWGWRWRPGRFGVVLRGGEALEVTKDGGRTFVVTVDDAATAASLLASLAARARSREG